MDSGNGTTVQAPRFGQPPSPVRVGHDPEPSSWPAAAATVRSEAGRWLPPRPVRSRKSWTG